MTQAGLLQAASRHGRCTRGDLLERKRLDDELVAEFAASPVQDLQELAGRQVRCREARARRAGWRDLRDAVRDGGSWSCKSATCSACRRRHHVRPYQTRVYHRWVEIDASNEDCSLATIHLALVADPGDLRAVVIEARRALRDLRDRTGRQQPGWRRVEFAGLVEVGAQYRADIPLLLPGQADVISQLPTVGSGGEVMWLPHLHVAVHHRGVAREDLRRALEAQWPGPERRVHVAAFDETRMPAENAADIIGYAAKAQCTSTVGGIEEIWPASLRAQWWAAIRCWGRGLEPLRVQVRPMRRQGQTDEAARRQTSLDRQPASGGCGVDEPAARPLPMGVGTAREGHALPTPTTQLSTNSEIGGIGTEADRVSTPAMPSPLPLVPIVHGEAKSSLRLAGRHL